MTGIMCRMTMDTQRTVESSKLYRGNARQPCAYFWTAVGVGLLSILWTRTDPGHYTFVPKCALIIGGGATFLLTMIVWVKITQNCGGKSKTSCSSRPMQSWSSSQQWLARDTRVIATSWRTPSPRSDSQHTVRSTLERHIFWVKKLQRSSEVTVEFGRSHKVLLQLGEKAKTYFEMLEHEASGTERHASRWTFSVMS